MLPNKKSKVYLYVFAIILAAITGYYVAAVAGYSIKDGKFYLQGINEGIAVIQSSWFALYWNRYSLPCILCGISAAGLWVLYDVSLPSKYCDGKEHGSSEWGNPKKICKRLEDKTNPGNNRYLARDVRISMNAKITMLNNNGVIIGGSGAGKTLFIVSPNLYYTDSSVMVIDSKGDLLKRHADDFRNRGYLVKVLDLIDPDKSDRYNPFRYLRTEEDVQRLAHNFMENTTDKQGSRGDSFWTDEAKMLLSALILYVWMERPAKEKNLITVLKLLAGEKLPDDGTESALSALMHKLPPTHSARIKFDEVYVGAADTIRSVLAVLNSRMHSLYSPKIQRLLMDDDLDLASLGVGHNGDETTRTALFLRIPDNDTTFNYIISNVYSNAFYELYYQADNVCGGSLPIPVTIWMDEFANVALPADFTSLEATMRSRNISVQIIVQNIAQLKALYKDTWETIIGNADVMVYLGGNEQSSFEYVARRLGKATIDKKSDSQSHGKGSSSSISHDRMQRELLTESEVGLLPKDKCIIFIRGEKPIITHKFDTLHDEKFFKYKDANYQHPVLIKRDRRGKIISASYPKTASVEQLSEKSLKHYKRAEDHGDNVVVYNFDISEVINYNPTQLAMSVREKYFHPEYADDITYAADPARRDNKNAKESIIQLFLDNAYSNEQLAEILVGHQNGLSALEIQSYSDPMLSVEEMRERRVLVEQMNAS